MRKLRLLIDRLRDDSAQSFVQAFAFSLLLSLAPLLTIFVIAFKQLALDTDLLINAISAYLPMEEVMEFIQYIQATNTSEFVSLVILLATTLFLSSRSVYSFLRFSSDIEGVDYPNWYLRINAVWGQLLFISLIVVLVIIVSFIRTSLIQYLLVPASLFIGFTVYYRNLSFTHRKVGQHWRGALITTILLMAMGLFFLTYVSNFTNYESLYGPLASLMVILLSIYILSYIIFIGFLINYVNYDDDNQTVHLKNFHKLKKWYDNLRAQ